MKEIFNYAASVIVLILMVLCVISPVEVFAEGPNSNTEICIFNNSVSSNSFEGFECNDYNADTSDAVQTKSGSNYYTTAKSAGEELRKGLVDRKKNILIKYKIETSKLSNSDWFSSLCDNILAYAFMHTGIPNEGDSLRHVVKSYKSKAEYLKYSEYTYVTINFDFVYYTTAAQENKLDSHIMNVKGSLNLDNKSDYEIVKGIYDYICNHVVYDSGSENIKYTAYSALVNESAACQGYAVLFYRLALEYDIDVRVITGKGRSQRHAWNIVEVDGKYYNVDSTWDAGDTEYEYFLKGSNNFDNHIRNYEYNSKSFISRYPTMTSNYACENHVWDKNYTVDLRATYACEGSKSIHCSLCGAKKKESVTTIPKLVCKLQAPETVTANLTSKYGVMSGYDDIKVTWPEVKGASGYFIKYKQTGSQSWKSAFTSNRYMILKDLADGAKYEIAVTPYVKENGIKYKSSNNKSITSVYTLKKTLITGGIKKLSGKITIKWNGIEGETGYQLFRASTKNGKYEKVATVNITDKKTVSVTVDAKKGANYWYKVRPYKKINSNNYVYGPWSDKKLIIR